MGEFCLESLTYTVEMGEFEHCCYDNIETNFEISSEDFLTYAEYDLTAKYDHHLVNKLSNTKRAIDSQLNALLIRFGLSDLNILPNDYRTGHFDFGGFFSEKI